jgi:hypothetical protein
VHERVLRHREANSDFDFRGLYNAVLGIPDPDPHVFGPPGSASGSISQRYGSGSRSFYQ